MWGDAGLPMGFGERIWAIHLSMLFGLCPIRDMLCPDLLGPQGLRISSGFYLSVILKSALLLGDRGWCLE